MRKPWNSDINIRDLIRPDILDIEEYIPLVPPEVWAKQMDIPLERIVKLDGNENPYGCSPRVQQALAEFQRYHRYPDTTHMEIRCLLEDYVGIDAQHIMVGNGSDELIDLLLRLLLVPGDKTINCIPTFGMYSFSTEICGGTVTKVTRTPGYDIDMDKVGAAVDDRTKIIFVASPNNPTGNAVPPETIRDLLALGPVVVVDEAYYEFCGTTVAPWITRYDNLIVLRTFSKWAGLAGLRVGYGLFPKEIIDHLWKIKPPYNVNIAAQIAVRESLIDLGYLRETVQAIVTERDRLFLKLKNIDYLLPLPSQANFIYVRLLQRQGLEVKERLKQDGILVRYFDTPLLRNGIRISVGRPADTDALIDKLTKG